MSDAVSPHGFTVTRRGYDTAQVDQALVRSTAQRDAAWERLSGLGNRMRALEQTLIDAAAAEKAAAEAPPAAYAVLSDRAARLLALAQEESVHLRTEAEAWTEALDTEVRADAARCAQEGADDAARLRGSADEAFRRELDRARATAEGLRGEADRAARATREAAAGHAAELAAGSEQAAEAERARQAVLQQAADQALAEAETEQDAREAALSGRAERRQGEAERHLAAMRLSAAATEAEAVTAAERLLEAARREAERIAAAAEREALASAEQQAELRAHLDHIRATLTALTGAAAGEP
ncbi:hypothetical protein [Streptacidiphilus cavernicola]|uniref:Cellulose-binding protein n=1 Tax=Streptacidiphilus cavernicola TaxID=3342716 RepID=A0ABV6VN30_9ACTN